MSIVNFFNRYILYFNIRSPQQFASLLRPVFLGVNHPPDAGLDDEFRTFDARRRGNVYRRPLAAVRRSCDLRNRIRLGMEDVGLGQSVGVLADILKACRRPVVTVRDNHLVLDDERADLPPLAIGVLRPDSGHAEVAFVYFVLLIHCFNGQLKIDN